MQSCNTVMTMDPTCCLATDNVACAAEIMRSEDVGSVPVVDDPTSKRLVGILTDRDIVLKVVADGKDAKSSTIEDVMTRNPITCKPEEDIQNAFDRMSQHQVRRMPVVDGKGKIVGIISQADLATRLDRPEKFEKAVEQISQPIA